MTNGYTRESITKNICHILNTEFHVKDKITDDKQKLPLTSFFFGLNAIQLYQFLMAVEEKYDIYLSASEIEENGFETVEKVVNLVQLKL